MATPGSGSMEFNGTFDLEETTAEEVWLALSDPVLIQDSLPGCTFLIEVDSDDVAFEALEERAADRDAEPTGDPEVIAARAFEEGTQYAALIEVSVGSVNPRFETIVTVDSREFPEMAASGEGNSSSSSFELTSGMQLDETEAGVTVEWWATTEVFGRIAQMGQRVIKPVANRIVKKFFERIQQRLEDLALDESEQSVGDVESNSQGLSQRIRDKIGI